MEHSSMILAKRLCVLFALLALACGGTASQSQDEDLGRVEQEVVNGFNTGNPTNSAMPYILLPNNGRCSGVLMKNLAAMTAKHCVDDYVNTPLTVTVVQGQHWSQVNSITLHSTLDVAVLRLQNRLPAVVNGQISFFNYARGIYGGSEASLHGKDVMIFGYGHNTAACTGAGTLRHAVLRTLNDAQPGVFVHQNSSGQIGHLGDSGAPLLDGFSTHVSRLVAIQTDCGGFACGSSPPSVCWFDTAPQWGFWAAWVLAAIPS